ncbi:MAG TPA: MFS transporter [Pseudonocardiaceae bacterium]|nr:MFS transporter [Pseudonocardiaceae bacterium]
MKTAILRDNRDYVRLWGAAAVSELGSQLTLIAFPLLVLGLGGNAAQAGLVASCSLLTRLVLRLPGGHLADRLDRRRLMLTTDLVRLVAVGSIPLAAMLHGPAYPQLLAVAAIEGAATALFGPGASIALRDVVARERLTEAFAMSQARVAAIDMAGPALGGLLFGIDRVLPFTVDAASYGMSAVLLLGIRARQQQRSGGRRPDGGVTAGFQWLRRQSSVLRVLTFCCVVNLVAAAADVLVVVSMRIHGASGATIGVVMACAGAGAVVGSLLAMRVIRLLPSARLFVAVGAVWAVGCAVFATTRSPWVIAPLLLVMMLLAPATGIRLGEITLGQAPAGILGRVSTAQSMTSTGLASAGPLLAGVGLQAIGGPLSWAILAAFCVAAAVFVAAPALRSRADLLAETHA